MRIIDPVHRAGGVLRGLGLQALSGHDKESLFNLLSCFLEQVPTGFLIKDRNLRYIYANDYIKRAYKGRIVEGGQAKGAFPGDPALSQIEEEDLRAFAGEVLEVFVTIPDAYQVSRPFKITKFPIDLAGGERVIGYVMDDITRLKEIQDRLSTALSDRELLIKEVYHRIKNNLAIVGSLLRLGSQDIEDERALSIFEDSYRRIESLAFLHEELCGSASMSELDFGRFLRNVAERIFGSMNNSNGIRLRVEVESLDVPVASAVPLALIANELVTNTLKYAFEGRRTGLVKVSLKREGEGAIMSVADDGIGLPEGLLPEKATSLGFVLIYNLAAQIGGGVERAGPPGTEFRVRLAAPPVQAG